MSPESRKVTECGDLGNPVVGPLMILRVDQIDDFRSYKGKGKIRILRGVFTKVLDSKFPTSILSVFWTE